MGRLDGKICVITGAGGGMGKEAAILFSAEGAGVCAADVNLEAAKATAVEARDAFAQQVDVADEAAVEAMMAAAAERYGGIDVLYNNAGISPNDDGSVLETTVEAWDRVQAVNTKGVFLCCKHGIPYLQRRGGRGVRVARREGAGERDHRSHDPGPHSRRTVGGSQPRVKRA